MMFAVAEADILERAKELPIGYFEECKQLAKIDGDLWRFESEDYWNLVKKYRKYSVSGADPYRERISGCCDRADQY